MANRVLVVLPDQSFHPDFWKATHKHIKYHFSDDNISLVCIPSMEKTYTKHFDGFVTEKSKQVDLNNIQDINIKDIDVVILMYNLDGSEPDVVWSEDSHFDIYRNFMHGYGGLRKILYKPTDKPSFYLGNKKNAFHEIASEANDNLSFFPYLNFSHLNSKFGEDSNHEYGFRIPDDYQNLANRSQDTRLIAFTGGSSCFGYSSFVGERFTDLLEIKLNENSSGINYKILNFAFEGHQIINEMNTYLLFIQKLKPDIIISYTGLNDLTMGMTSDCKMQKEYDISYQYYLEEMAKRISGSEKTLPCFKRHGFPVSSSSIVVSSFYERLVQFQQLVENAGTKFISVFQPIVHSKIRLSEREELLTDLHNSYQANARSAKTKNGVNNATFIKFLYEKFSLYAQKKGLESFINLHELIRNVDSNISIFNDIAHQSEEGDQVISNLLFEQIQEKGLLANA